MYANYPFNLLMENQETFTGTFPRHRLKSVDICSFYWALCCPEHSTESTPLFMLTECIFGFHRALKGDKDEILLKFKNTVCLLGAATMPRMISVLTWDHLKDEEWNNGNGTIGAISYGKLFVLLGCCSIYTHFLHSFCFLEQKINLNNTLPPPTLQKEPQSQISYNHQVQVRTIKTVMSNSLSRRKLERNLQFIFSFWIRFRTGCYTNETISDVHSQ